MAVHSKPRLKTFKAEGVIRPFRAVKWGATKDQMLECGANDKGMGIYQGEKTLAVDDFGDVALPGGGALMEISETLAAGKFLTPTAAGLGEIVDLAGEMYNAISQESGVNGDVIAVEVLNASESVSSDV